MNYLAHAYLSFNHEAILVGNMISDFVKGRKKFDYPLSIQHGIALHRAIDTYTDTHPATTEAKQCFRPVVRLYAGAFIDVVYDHFLANDTNEFKTENDLAGFAGRVYEMLQVHQGIFPEHFQLLFPYMQSQNWLLNYRTFWGTEKSFEGLIKRAAYLSPSGKIFKVFEKNYTPLKNCYTAFFPDVKNFAARQLQTLLNS